MCDKKIILELTQAEFDFIWKAVHEFLAYFRNEFAMTKNIGIEDIGIDIKTGERLARKLVLETQ